MIDEIKAIVSEVLRQICAKQLDEDKSLRSVNVPISTLLNTIRQKKKNTEDRALREVLDHVLASFCETDPRIKTESNFLIINQDLAKKLKSQTPKNQALRDFKQNNDLMMLQQFYKQEDN